MEHSCHLWCPYKQNIGKDCISLACIPCRGGKGTVSYTHGRSWKIWYQLFLLTRKTCSGNTPTPEAWETVHQTTHHSYKSKIKDNRSRKLDKLWPKIIQLPPKAHSRADKLQHRGLQETLGCVLETTATRASSTTQSTVQECCVNTHY